MHSTCSASVAFVLYYLIVPYLCFGANLTASSRLRSKGRLIARRASIGYPILRKSSATRYVLLSDIEECRNDKARTVWRKQPQDQAGKIAKKEERDEANNPIPKETKQKLEKRCRENAPKLVACYYNHATGAMESDFWGKVDKAKKAAAVAELKRRLKEVI